MNGLVNLLSRRRFLTTLVLVSGSVLGGVGYQALFSPDWRKIAERMVTLLERHDIARQIGKRYVELDSAVAHLTLEQLTESLLKAIKLNANAWSDATPEKSLVLFSNKLREDFVLENIVKIDGWILSETEARLCALLHKVLV
ncbi:MAG: hypothetical protein GXP09_08810 [Gammaproteobacteria bacterium]|nr:hypothetical protein [Gammaproteobacteria bacterium]